DLSGDGLIGPSTIGAGETLEVISTYSGQVSFTASTGILELLNSSGFVGTVAGMTGQDTIDFADIDPTKVQRPTYSGTASGGTLTVTDRSHTANIALLGNYIASTFVTSKRWPWRHQCRRSVRNRDKSNLSSRPASPRMRRSDGIAK